MTKMMKLGLLLHTGGQHIAAWRHPDGIADAGFNLPYYRKMARMAEDAKLDFIFVADTMGVRDWPVEVLVRSAQMSLLYEPLTLMVTLAADTSRIGFVVTASTSYSQPYTVARQFASFDHLSGGRAAWNVVTGAQNSEAANFGMTLPDHDERYARAGEFVEVVKGLWATSDPGVIIADKQAGLLFDQAKIRPLHHEGKYYKVDGILNVPPSPQGRPILVQAGASGAGRELASSIAEIIFAGVPVKAAAQEYYGDVKRRMEAKGRRRESAVIMPGIIPIIGRTRAEAEARLAELDALIHPDVAITVLSDMVGTDLSAYPLDGPLPELADNNKSKTMNEIAKLVAGRDNMTIRQLANWMCAGMTHLRIAGTAAEIADLMQEWVQDEACDGFLLSPLIYPSGLEEFVDQVLPILRERGLFRTDYEGATMRENLGLQFM